ncbi:MAG: type 2 isopentenyl-diphosphate Delta-isomerase [Candidatus Eremiobacteraeota bacterium]|nr:type 2 isopentenyl-diphosphate Delta-isomerase [Candidatus Eremiobacteraeota bacterium]MBV8499303.1 type 2 isopentenyl-diphosphate Delta-isomerase [Candidatus Eremiobacteraeota bacterium]
MPSARPEDATPSRKAEHLRINIERDVAGKGVGSGFDALRFEHRALPEIDFGEVDSACEIFGHGLGAPLLVSCMTGGTPAARAINRRLATVAQGRKLAMGLGSGRALIESPESIESFDVRAEAPDVLLFANLGAVQLNKGYGLAQCRRLVESLRADALVLHLNPLQEALQPEGDTCFRGLLRRIGELCAEAEFPVVVKEVGWGIAADDVRRLFDAGVAAVDLAGAGGTSWSEVERHRIAEPWRAGVAAAFADWGIPTARCLIAARRVAPDATLFASGGIRTGLDVAKAVALGADLAGIAGPFLRAADRGVAEADALARELIETLRVAMFCVGARTLGELRETPLRAGP